MKTAIIILGSVLGSTGYGHTTRSVIAADETVSAKNQCVGAGPQSPRNISQPEGENTTAFDVAPRNQEMNLCNIHFHKFAEHQSAEGFATRVDRGSQSGFVCNGSTPPAAIPGVHEHGESCEHMQAGDTVEFHWVYTTCEISSDIEAGAGLGACVTPTCANPQLRVESRVFLLGKNTTAVAVTQAPPAVSAVQYRGSTTGPSYSNTHCSPYQVTWNVGSTCMVMSLSALKSWCSQGGNPYGETLAHFVRDLVIDPRLLSAVEHAHPTSSRN